MKLKKFFVLTRAGIIESLQFRISAVTVLVGNIIYIIITYFLWKAIYSSVETDIVNGMTFYDTMIYLALATALFSFMETYIVWSIGPAIQNGKIVLDILKPMKYRSYVFWSYSGSYVMNFFMTFLPTFVIVYFMTDHYIRLGSNILLFIPSVVMATVINFSIDYIICIVCFYTESIWGVNIMKEVVVLLLSGATIPLAFFPETFRKVLYFLPFQSVYNAPLTILINRNIDMAESVKILGIQLLWCLVMIGIGELFWKISIRKITVNGG